VILFQESIFSPYQKAMGLVVIIPEANGKVTTYGDLSYGKGKGIKE
jgi:alkylated DNA nucleotide flippase Atl1